MQSRVSGKGQQRIRADRAVEDGVTATGRVDGERGVHARPSVHRAAEDHIAGTGLVHGQTGSKQHRVVESGGHTVAVEVDAARA